MCACGASRSKIIAVISRLCWQPRLPPRCWSRLSIHNNQIKKYFIVIIPDASRFRSRRSACPPMVTWHLWPQLIRQKLSCSEPTAQLRLICPGTRWGAPHLGGGGILEQLKSERIFFFYYFFFLHCQAMVASIDFVDTDPLTVATASWDGQVLVWGFGVHHLSLSSLLHIIISYHHQHKQQHHHHHQPQHHQYHNHHHHHHNNNNTTTTTTTSSLRSGRSHLNILILSDPNDYTRLGEGGGRDLGTSVRENIDSFWGFIEKFSLFLNGSEALRVRDPTFILFLRKTVFSYCQKALFVFNINECIQSSRLHLCFVLTLLCSSNV